jgi:hypothetical protein
MLTLLKKLQVFFLNFEGALMRFAAAAHLLVQYLDLLLMPIDTAPRGRLVASGLRYLLFNCSLAARLLGERDASPATPKERVPNRIHCRLQGSHGYRVELMRRLWRRHAARVMVPSRSLVVRERRGVGRTMQHDLFIHN